MKYVLDGKGSLVLDHLCFVCWTVESYNSFSSTAFVYRCVCKLTGESPENEDQVYESCVYIGRIFNNSCTGPPNNRFLHAIAWTILKENNRRTETAWNYLKGSLNVEVLFLLWVVPKQKKWNFNQKNGAQIKKSPVM